MRMPILQPLQLEETAMANEKLLVLTRVEDWIITIESSLRKFPKSYRFTLAQKIELTSFECLDHISSANLDKPGRPNHIFNARVATERLMVLIRIAKRLKLMDVKHYELYAEKLIEIAKMLAGWARVSN